MGSNCSIKGCKKLARARRMCQMHYSRWLKHADPLISYKTTKRTLAAQGAIGSRKGLVQLNTHINTRLFMLIKQEAIKCETSLSGMVKRILEKHYEK